MITIAINGFGRIGRNILRSLYESSLRDQIKIVAVNDKGVLQHTGYLLQYDSIHGRLPLPVAVSDNTLSVDGDSIALFCEKDPTKLPWGDLAVDLVLECTGVFLSREGATKHIEAGAQRVLLSAPSKNSDIMVVYGVNDDQLRPEHRIISNASCTTNCLAPLVFIFHKTVGIQNGLMTTIHAATNDQSVVDVHHKDLRRGRSALLSMIPTSTGAARAIGEVIPDLKGKLDGLAVRVPLANTSLLDFTFQAKRETSVTEINEVARVAAQGDLSGILQINSEPLVSCDFNHCSASSIFDETQTAVIDNQVKVLAWYDNEWGFSHRMIDTALAIGALDG